VGKYSPWEPTATLSSAGAAVGSAAQSAHRGRRGAGHIVAAARLQLVLDDLQKRAAYLVESYPEHLESSFIVAFVQFTGILVACRQR